MTKYFDSHAHYFDRKFEDLSESYISCVDDLLGSQLMCDNVCGIINVGTNPENSISAISQAMERDIMYTAVGIHPEDAQTLSLDPEVHIAQIEELISDTAKRCEYKIVAIGEIGLDYHWEPVNKELQKAFFEGQLELAEKYGLPVIVHDREAHGDSFETVMRHPKVKGVFHAYSGSSEMARELIRRGWYIGLGGAVTFKNAERLRAVAAGIPLDRLLIETDCPYMTPVPFRGNINHSAYLPYVARVLAELHNVSEEEIAMATRENVRALFLV